MTAGGWRNKALHGLEPAAGPHQPHDQQAAQFLVAGNLAANYRGDDRNPEEDYVTMAAGAGSARMQRAIRSDAICTLGGNCSTQRGCAKLQRGANEQLAGA